MLILAIATVSSAFAAECTEWDAGLSANRTRGHGSSSLTYMWASAPSCDSFALDHYEICWNDAVAGDRPPAPTTPDEASHCSSVSSIGGASTLKENVYRSNRAFAVSVFACADSSCDSWFGDGSVDETVVNGVAVATTAKERWVVEGVSDVDDTDRVVDDDAATSPAAVVYGPGTAAPGRLGLWYATKVGGIDTIMQVSSTTLGWQSWNTYATWAPADAVVQAPIDPSGAFGSVGSPWVVPATDGLPYIRLFFSADDDGSSTTGTTSRLYSIDSSDTLGKDFDLECTGPACTVDTSTCLSGYRCDFEDESADGGAAMLEVNNSGGEDSSWLTKAGHGRLVFPYVSDADKLVDFATESPLILLTGAASAYGGADELFVGSWSGTEWQIANDPTEECPIAQIEDASDPAVIALPNGLYKVYVHTDEGFDVCLFDGSEWLDCQPVELAYDDGSTIGAVDTSLSTCLDQLDTVSTRSGAYLVEGGFARAQTRPGCFEPDNGGILYIEHRN